MLELWLAQIIRNENIIIIFTIIVVILYYRRIHQWLVEACLIFNFQLFRLVFNMVIYVPQTYQIFLILIRLCKANCILLWLILCRYVVFEIVFLLWLYDFIEIECWNFYCLMIILNQFTLFNLGLLRLHMFSQAKWVVKWLITYTGFTLTFIILRVYCTHINQLGHQLVKTTFILLLLLLHMNLLISTISKV